MFVMIFYAHHDHAKIIDYFGFNWCWVFVFNVLNYNQLYCIYSLKKSVSNLFPIRLKVETSQRKKRPKRLLEWKTMLQRRNKCNYFLVYSLKFRIPHTCYHDVKTGNRFHAFIVENSVFYILSETRMLRNDCFMFFWPRDRSDRGLRNYFVVVVVVGLVVVVLDTWRQRWNVINSLYIPRLLSFLGFLGVTNCP